MRADLESGVYLEYERFGSLDLPAIILIRGLGTQLIDWPPRFIDALNEAGLQVVVFDNRDCGLSQKFEGAPDAKAVHKGLVDAPYNLSDMALDVVQLMDVLDIARAHVVAVSLGGMIGQVLAAEHPDRLRSFFSVMSSSSRRGLPAATPEAAATLAAETDPNADRESIINASVWGLKVCGSPAYPMPEAKLRAIVEQRYDRDYDPLTGTRQMAAVAATGDRSELLAAIRVPTCVIHGDADPLVPIEAGIDTAEQIPGAQFKAIAGMGHDIPDGVEQILCDLITGFISEYAA